MVVLSPTRLSAPREEPQDPLPAPRASIRAVDLRGLRGRKPLSIGIDQSVRHFALGVYSPEDGSAHLWLYEDKFENGVRLLVNLRRWLSGLLQELKLRSTVISHVCMEAPAFAQATAAHQMGEIEAVVKLCLVEVFGVANKLAYPTLVGTSQVKKFSTGSGGSAKRPVTKAVIIKEVFRKWGVDVDNDNLADAYVLARVASALDTGMVDYAYEQDVLDALVRHTEWDIPTTRAARPRRKRLTPTS